MEILVFVIAVVALVVYALWRVQRGGSGEVADYRVPGEPFDRAKDAGILHGSPYGRHPLDAPGKRGEIPAPRRVSREQGHGKDGGG